MQNSPIISLSKAPTMSSLSLPCEALSPQVPTKTSRPYSGYDPRFAKWLLPSKSTKVDSLLP